MANNIAILRFEESLNSEELRCFRGAIIEMVGRDEIAFHNHGENGYQYGYPTIQYKVMKGHVCVVGLSDSCFSVLQLANKFPCELKIGKKEFSFHVKDCTLTPYEPFIEDAPKLYHLRQYMALTDENFKKYHSLLALTDKIVLLEKIITGNILSLLKGVGYHASEHIEVAITEFTEIREKAYKQVKFDLFDLKFVSNIELPEGLALGKSVSVGFGTIYKCELPDQFKNL